MSLYQILLFEIILYINAPSLIKTILLWETRYEQNTWKWSQKKCYEISWRSTFYFNDMIIIGNIVNYIRIWMTTHWEYRNHFFTKTFICSYHHTIVLSYYHTFIRSYFHIYRSCKSKITLTRSETITCPHLVVDTFILVHSFKHEWYHGMYTATLYMHNTFVILHNNNRTDM